MQLTHRAWGLNSSTPSLPQVLFCRKAEGEGKGQCHSQGTIIHLSIKANTPDPIDQRSQWYPQRPWTGCCRRGERQHSKYGSSPLWPPDPHLSSSSEESSGTLVNLALWITFYSATIQWKLSQRNSHSTWDPTFPDQALPFCFLLNPKRKIQSVTHEDARLHMMCQNTGPFQVANGSYQISTESSAWQPESIYSHHQRDRKTGVPGHLQLCSSVTEAWIKESSTSKESSRICKGSLLSSILIGSIGCGPNNFVTAELLNQEKWLEWTITMTVKP